MDPKETLKFVSESIDSTVIPTLCEYISIPNTSIAYDVTKTNSSETDKVIDLFVSWVKNQSVPGLHCSVRRLPNRSPLIFLSIDASADVTESGTILMYGHLDKQPPFDGWDADLGPYKPVIKDNIHGRVLYGRGGADDGYSIFSSVLAIKAMLSQGCKHSKIVILIEASEESGSPDLPAHLESLITDKLVPDDVSLVVCLDSGAGDYQGLWLTNSLRGIMVATLKVSTVSEGLHSGIAGGIVSDSFRVIRQILSAIENEKTAEICEEFQVTIPQGRIEEVKQYCDIVGDEAWKQYHPLNNRPMRIDSLTELVLDNTWRANLTVIGQDGLPACAAGGNVLRPSTAVKLSLRLPPTFDHLKAFDMLKNKIQAACPPDAKCEITLGQVAGGYNAPDLVDWLKDTLNETSTQFFGREFANLGCGGTIPFMGMLGVKFPAAQFVITGLLGPDSNAHGPNEFLHIDYCKKLTACIAHILYNHGQKCKLGSAVIQILHSMSPESFAHGKCC